MSMLPSAPLASHNFSAMLRELCANGATGELHCQRDRSEARIYLRSGRLAWADAPNHRKAFARALQDASGLDREALAKLVTQCKAQGVPLAAGLVCSGAASLEQVRSAVRRHLALALAAASELEGAECRFAKHEHFDAYDHALTFSLDGLVRDARTDSLIPPKAGCPVGTARYVFQEVFDCDWVERFSASVCLERASAKREPAQTPAQLRELLGTELDFVAVRRDERFIVGSLLRDRVESVWSSGLSHSAYGYACAVTSRIAQTALSLPKAGAASRPAAAPPVTQTPSAITRAARRLMADGRDMLGACHLVDGAVASQTARSDAEGALFEPAARLAQVGFSPDCRWSDALSQRPARWMLVGGTSACWYFGCLLSEVTGESVWVAIDRSSPQGAGWFYLGSLLHAMGAG